MSNHSLINSSISFIASNSPTLSKSSKARLKCMLATPLSSRPNRSHLSLCSYKPFVKSFVKHLHSFLHYQWLLELAIKKRQSAFTKLPFFYLNSIATNYLILLVNTTSSIKIITNYPEAIVYKLTQNVKSVINSFINKESQNYR